MKGITNTNDFDNCVRLNETYYDVVNDLVSKINLNDRNILNSIEGKSFDFFRDNSASKNTNRVFISNVIRGYSDSLTNVRKGYIYQDQVTRDSISNR